MPDDETMLTKAQILQALRDTHGIELSGFRFQYLQKQGFVPPAKPVWGGRARGMHGLWPEETIGDLAVVCGLVEDGYTIRQVRWAWESVDAEFKREGGPQDVSLRALFCALRGNEARLVESWKPHLAMRLTLRRAVVARRWKVDPEKPLKGDWRVIVAADTGGSIRLENWQAMEADAAQGIGSCVFQMQAIAAFATQASAGPAQIS